MTIGISPDLLADLQDRLKDAIERVSEGAATAGVSLAFSVKRDKEGCIVTRYALKGGHARQGEWYPPVQAPLPFDATAPDTQADAEAEAWRPDPGPGMPLAQALNLESGKHGLLPEGFTPPVYRRLGQVTRHRLRIGEDGTPEQEALCNAPGGMGAYQRVDESSGGECTECRVIAGALSGVIR